MYADHVTGECVDVSHHDDHGMPSADHGAYITSDEHLWMFQLARCQPSCSFKQTFQFKHSTWCKVYSISDYRWQQQLPKPQTVIHYLPAPDRATASPQVSSSTVVVKASMQHDRTATVSTTDTQTLQVCGCSLPV
jgi:hypothetical protein